MQNDKSKYRGNYRQTLFALKTLSRYNFTSVLAIQNVYNLGVNESEIVLDKFCLLKTNLMLNDYERQIKGELLKFANNFYPKLNAESNDVIYNKFISELQHRQSNVYNPTIIDIDELLSRKSFTTEEFRGLIKVTYQVQIPTADQMYHFLNIFY